MFALKKVKKVSFTAERALDCINNTTYIIDLFENRTRSLQGPFMY